MRREEYEDVDLGKGRLLRETGLAILVRLEDRKNEERWIPKSMLSDDSEVYGKDDGVDGGEGHVIIKGWFAEREGLQ